MKWTPPTWVIHTTSAAAYACEPDASSNRAPSSGSGSCFQPRAHSGACSPKPRTRTASGRQAFDFLPSLKFYSTETEPTGEVERVELKALPALSREQRRELAQIAGRSPGALHLARPLRPALGKPRDRRRRARSPRVRPARRRDDPRRSLLAHRNQAPARPRSGVRGPLSARLWRSAKSSPTSANPSPRGDLLAMIAALRRTLAFLERHSSAIADVFTSLPSLRETPIRVCLRSTGDTCRARSGVRARSGRRSSTPRRNNSRGVTSLLLPPLRASRHSLLRRRSAHGAEDLTPQG